MWPSFATIWWLGFFLDQTHKIVEFGNLISVKEKGCRIEKGWEITWNHMSVRHFLCVLTILQRLPSYSSYRLVTTTVMLQLPFSANLKKKLVCRQTSYSYCLPSTTPTNYPLQTSNTIATFLLLPFNGNYLLAISLPSYFSSKYKKYFHCKRKEEAN